VSVGGQHDSETRLSEYKQPLGSERLANLVQNTPKCVIFGYDKLVTYGWANMGYRQVYWTSYLIAPLAVGKAHNNKSINVLIEKW
jgi:hypothetical protein